MRRIDIRSLDELNKLKELRGEETIYLVIDEDKIPKKLYAIDLSKFKGTIMVSFKKEKNVYRFQIGTNSKINKFFFKNTKANIKLPYNSQCFFTYFQTCKTVSVINEEELRAAIKEFKDGNNIEIKINKSFLVVSEVTIPEKMKIRGNNFTITTSSAKVKEQLKKRNVNCIKLDKIIRIKTVDDLNKLYNLTNEKVYVEFLNDICGAKMTSISLKEFTGILYINGKGHAIKNSKIMNGKSGGFFSTIHLQGSLIIQNLHFESCSFLGDTEYLGAFLGTREKNGEFYSSPATTLILNSSVKYCFFDESEKKAGIFIGSGDEFTEIYRGYACQNFSKKKNIVHFFGNSNLETVFVNQEPEETQINRILSLEKKKT